ncbi:MAG: preprotein translocase subunit SecG, partial [Betaproteobacteria bacterium]|nr:preprotein translocase subunit SecG [Betaproteobacteria bacterium]
MAWLSSVLLVVQVLCALAVIVLVLIQQGKGAEMGAAFGSSGGGASGSLFGATGSANFLSRATAIAATLFFTATLGLAYLGNSAAKSSQLPKSVMEQGPTSQIPGQTGSTPATNPPAAVPNPAANSVPTSEPTRINKMTGKYWLKSMNDASSLLCNALY